MGKDKKMTETIALATDHAGVALKAQLADFLVELGYEVLNLGADDAQSVDYPDYGKKAAEALLEGKAEKAIIICGSGIGISIAANRYPGIRAALCHNVTTATLAREHNDANILALGARMVSAEEAKQCVQAFLTTAFAAGRHTARVEKLDQLNT